MHELPPKGSEGGIWLGEAIEATKGDEADLNRRWKVVPWRTIVATVAIVLLTYLAYQLVLSALRVIALVIISGFFAIVLTPVVAAIQRRVGDRRNLATGLVVLPGLILLLGLLALFIWPVRTQLIAVFSDLPGEVQNAADGRGPFGRLVERLGLADYVRDNEADLREAAENLSSSSFDIVRTILGVVFAFVTITVITFLMLSQSAGLARFADSIVPFRRRESVRRVAGDAGVAIRGYMVGNLIISLIAGVTTYLLMLLLGVPQALVIALFVAFVDLIPLVGAIIGAAVASLAAFLDSSSAGIISIIFFVIYQQIENSVLYPAVMARKVNVNPLVVLLSVLLAAELFGILGALFAVPVSGASLVIVKAIRSERQRERLHLPIQE